MPIMECEIDGKKGFKWGHHGTCYVDRKDAERQAEAAYANGYTGDIALDASARTYDADGRLHIAKSHISKVAVNPYYGMEIPGYQELGLDPQKIYYMFRPPEELAKAAHTFARNPILSKHKAILSTEGLDPDLIIGTIGSDVEFNDPYLDADLCFWKSSAISEIENNSVRELSAAYRYVPVMTSGKYRGQHYDGIMTEIHGDHLAKVETGRAGPDVIAADGAITMKMTKLGKALFVTLGTAFPKLAQDSALPALVGTVTKKTLNKADLRVKLLAMDAECDGKKLDGVMDALSDMEDEPEPKEPKAGEDEGEEEETEEERKKREKKEAKDKAAKDKAAKDEAEKEEKSKAAMDSFKKELRDADEARQLVRPVVGDVIARDTAAEIYGFALDHLKVDHKDVKEPAALKALFTVASAKNAPAAAPRIAQDSAGLFQKFPAAARFRQA